MVVRAGAALLCLLALAGCADRRPPAVTRHSPAVVRHSVAAVTAPPRYDADRLMAALPARFHGMAVTRSPLTVAQLGPPGAGPLDRVEVDRPQCRAFVRGGQIWQFLHSAAVAPATPVATMGLPAAGPSAGATLVALPGGVAASAVTTPALPDAECATFHAKVAGTWRPASVRTTPATGFGPAAREVIREYPTAHGRVLRQQLLYAGHDYVALLWMDGPALKGVTFDAFARQVSAHVRAALN